MLYVNPEKHRKIVECPSRLFWGHY